MVVIVVVNVGGVFGELSRVGQQIQKKIAEGASLIYELIHSPTHLFNEVFQFNPVEIQRGRYIAYEMKMD